MLSNRDAGPPVLLPMAAYHGTLAAARCLGGRGIEVTLAESAAFVPAVWSRHVKRRVRSPSPEDPDRFMEWLLAFGVREPGYVLYPTSDDLAFLYARYRNELSRNFVLRHPPIEATWQLLNKSKLTAVAEAVGLSMPRTWVPQDDAALDEVRRSAAFPVVIKPQTQALFHPHAKGAMVARPEDLIEAYRRFLETTGHAAVVLAHDPQAGRPSVQEYVPKASEAVYGVTGFIDESGELFSVRASRKVLQQPRRLGVGLCFEEAELLPDLAARVGALCRRAGHYGVFEAEFIESAGKLMLIDFNPRFYGQMAFDIARGLPQPMLAYQHTLGRFDRVKEMVASAEAANPIRGLAYCRELQLRMLLFGRELAGSMTREEAARWRAWLESHRGNLVDGVNDAADRKPIWLDALHQATSFARHPRSYLRELIWS